MDISNCTTLNNLWDEAQRVWNEITIEEVNSLIESFENRIRSVAALDGLPLNGHQGGRSLIKSGCTVNHVRQLIAQETKLKMTFIEQSNTFFENESWERERFNELIDRSKEIIQVLPEAMRKKVNLIIYEPQEWI
jgi:hypothetical protein